MEAWERREKILNFLKNSNNPIKGTDLSNMYKVTRQVIVQDISLLRARGENILATPQGYIIPKTNNKSSIIKKIVCKHTEYSEIEDELKTIVDLGGRVIDVIVEHPLYGEIKGQLEINSRADVDEFMDSLRRNRAEPLSSLTEGIHLHTIVVGSEEMLLRIKKALKSKNYLINED